MLGMVLVQEFEPEFVPNGSDLHLRPIQERQGFASIYPRFTLGLLALTSLKKA